MSSDEDDLELFTLAAFEPLSVFAGPTLESSVTGKYTYLLADYHQNRIIGEIELQNVSYSRKLSGVGDASAEFLVPNARVAQNLRNNTVPGRTALYILRDGVPIWGGIIWKRAYDRNTRKVALSCSTFESYFYHIFQNETIVYDTDQLNIARGIVGTDIPEQLMMDVDSSVSGVTRVRTMFDYEYKTRGEELESLGALENGFDWNVTIGRDANGDFTRRLDFGYPFLGVAASTTGLVFEYPGNISSFSVSEDAESGGNRVTAIGGGEGEDQLIAVAEDAVALSFGFPLLETSRSYKSVVQPSTLIAHALDDLSRLRAPITLYTIQVRPSDDPPLGAYTPGDFARFVIDDVWMGQRVEFLSRITAFTVNVSDSGGPESVAVSFESAERTQEDSDVE